MKSHALVCITALVILAMNGCGGGRASDIDSVKQGQLTALHGSDIRSVSVDEFYPDNYWLDFESIPPEGIFLNLTLPAGLIYKEDRWYGDDHVIHVVGNGENGAEIGLRPISDYQGEKVALALYTQAGNRTVSSPPTGPGNAVDDLAIFDLGGGKMRLEWTELNVGDYNVNGSVEVADLTPIGVNFGVSSLVTGWSRDDPLFWVDGDRNSVISVSDITPIGQHFASTIAGYNVLRNGVVVTANPGDEVTVPRSEAQMRDRLPPRYSFEFDTLPTDEWSVAPVDPHGEMGTESPTVSLPAEPDLQVALSITGLDLLDLDGSGISGPLEASGRSLMKIVDPYDILRRIAPGDVPNLAAIGNSLGDDTPVANFYSLPRGSALALLVMYAPVNDLVTGNPKGGSGLRGSSQTIEIEHETTIIPLRLPDTGPTYLNVDISLDPNPDGGYFTDVSTEDSQAEDPPTIDVRLNNREMLVSLDNDQDDAPGDEFSDEAELGDADRFAASDQRLQRQVDADDYGTPVDTPVYGRIASFQEAAGTLELSDVYISDHQGGFIQQPSLTVLFSEDSDFIGASGDMDPSELAVDDLVALNTDMLADSELDPPEKYWLRALYRDSGEHDPIAILKADPGGGPSPVLVVFDASQSVDIFGNITKYRFDFGEGAGYEDFGLTTTAPHVYNTDGLYKAYLEVTDDAEPPNTAVDEIDVDVAGLSGDGTVNISITVNFNSFVTTNMLTRVTIFDHEPTGPTDIDWIGREPGDPNPYGLLVTDQPEDGVPQVLTWNGIVDGTYWYSVFRLVTTWEGPQDQYAIFGPFSIAGDTLNFDHVGEQYGEPPPVD